MENIRISTKKWKIFIILTKNESNKKSTFSWNLKFDWKIVWKSDNHRFPAKTVDFTYNTYQTNLIEFKSIKRTWLKWNHLMKKCHTQNLHSRITCHRFVHWRNRILTANVLNIFPILIKVFKRWEFNLPFCPRC